MIVIVSRDFHRDKLCRLVLDEQLMSAEPRRTTVPTTAGACGGRGRRQLTVAIVRDECQLPFGLASAELLLRCGHDSRVPPADMPRLRRLLKTVNQPTSVK